jgi:hypothetical protein
VTRHLLARHLLILALLLGMVTSNLSPVLGHGAGTVYRLLGLRQYWNMFAPNPTHDARFVEAYLGGEPLGISREPPGDGFFFAWGYDRIHKLHKQVALHPDRYAAAYASALCRLREVHGPLELRTVHRVAPKPSAARRGERAVRTESTIGTWTCP